VVVVAVVVVVLVEVIVIVVSSSSGGGSSSNNTSSSSRKWFRYCSNVSSRGGAVGRGTALQVGRSRVRFPMVSLEFYIDIILPAALLPWGLLSL
jgi:hypothetical protein